MGTGRSTIDLLPEAARAVTAVVAAVPATAWAAPSPCSEWTVRDVLCHLTSEHLWAPRLLRGESLEQVGDAYDGDVLGADPLAAWRRAMTTSMLAWAQADPAERVQTSLGPIEVAEYAHQMLLDLTVHGWDLAAGAGTPYTPVPDAVEDGIAYERPQVERGLKEGIFAPPTGYQGENRLGVLLSLTGRRPRPSAS